MINIDHLKESIEQHFLNKHLKEIRLITPKIFLFIFQENKEKVFLISLIATSFCACPVNYSSFMSELEKTSNPQFQKYLVGAKLDEIDRLNEQTLSFKLHKRGPLFTPIHFNLILELKLHNTNLIITENSRVVYAFKTYDLMSKRPLLMKMIYQPLQIEKLSKQADFSNTIDEYNHNLLHIYLNNQIKPLLKLFNKRLALLKRKLIALNQDLANWQTLIKQRPLYEQLLTHPNLHDHLTNIEVNNTLIQLDNRYSLIDNIQLLFAKYKKGKKALFIVEDQINLCSKEIDLINELISQPINTILEADYLYEVAQSLKLVKVKRQIDQKQPQKERPYQVTINNTTYLFGKTALQNDYLSFKIAQKNDYFFHIDNYPGAHVICKSKLLSEQQLLTAASICLILSKKEQGIVTYTNVSNIKKGKFKGQVYLKHGKTIKLNKMDPTIVGQIKLAKKI